MRPPADRDPVTKETQLVAENYVGIAVKRTECTSLSFCVDLRRISFILHDLPPQTEATSRECDSPL